MADNIPELKPCPFCEGAARHVVDPTVEASDFIVCTVCGVDLDDPEPEQGSCVESWNTRAAPKVKPLVWEEVEAGYFSAEEYSIECAISSRLEYDLKVYGAIIATSMAKDAVSALKRKASAHRRDRILSALR